MVRGKQRVVLEGGKGCVPKHVERRLVAASPRLAWSFTNWWVAGQATAVHVSCVSQDSPQGHNQES